jgi:peptidoglycan/xylan/chitin deacetylase (PgdA/CDA1 family)
MDNELYSYYPSIRRPRIEWPNGARVAFWIGLNIEHYLIDQPATSIAPMTTHLTPDPMNAGWRDYGTRVGIWRQMRMFDKFGIRASVLLNADVCSYYPEIIEEGNKRGWVWLAHGKNNSTLEANMTEDEERAYLSMVVETIARQTGKQPRGWLGPALTETFNTPSILAELGITYICDWNCDDQPFPMHVKSGRMIGLPYSIEVNDIPLFLGKSLAGPDFEQLLKDQFDVLYEEGTESGQVMAIALHPFITGLPFRARYLERALDYIASHDKVWLATSDDIADCYYQNYYEQDLARAERRAATVG